MARKKSSATGGRRKSSPQRSGDVTLQEAIQQLLQDVGAPAVKPNSDVAYVQTSFEVELAIQLRKSLQGSSGTTKSQWFLEASKAPDKGIVKHKIKLLFNRLVQSDQLVVRARAGARSNYYPMEEHAYPDVPEAEDDDAVEADEEAWGELEDNVDEIVRNEDYEPPEK